MQERAACIRAKGRLTWSDISKGLTQKKFFMKIFDADCARIAIENPVPSKIFKLPPHTQEIQPYQFGHPYTKKTRLWLRGLPMLHPTDIVDPIGPWVPSGTSRKQTSKYGYAPRGADAKNRAKTFSGIAKAMSDQWGNIDI